MKKQIKKYGPVNIITFSPDEMRIYGLKVGDILDLSDIILVRKRQRKKKK